MIATNRGSLDVISPLPPTKKKMLTTTFNQ